VLPLVSYYSLQQVYEFDLPDELPTVFPPQANDTPDLGLDDGDWAGESVPSGAYRVMLNASYLFDHLQVEERASVSALLDIGFGSGTPDSAAFALDDTGCTSCHGEIEAHGRRRAGLQTCVACHTLGAEDRYSPEDPSSTPGETIALTPMVHRIHAGDALSDGLVLNGWGMPFTPVDFSAVNFPRWDGGVQVCTACHTQGSAFIDSQAGACLSCHDSTDAKAHAALNTHPVYGESCDVCHGESREQSVELAHE